MRHDEQLQATDSEMMMRLARVETDLRAAQARILVLEQSSQHQTQRAVVSRRVAGGLGVVVLVAALGIMRAPQGEAQAKPAKKAANKAGAAKGGHVVRAPFSVVDAQGNTILRVQDRSPEAGRGIFVFNSQSKLVVNASADEKGHGSLIARNGGSERIAGPGAGFIFDAQGNAFLGMKGPDDKMFFTVDTKGLQLSKNDAVIVNLGMGSQGGLMNLCDYSGNTMIEAGILTTNRGVVRVFPMGGPAALTIPNYIMGAKPK
jgi:hypothetical protein